MNYAPLQWKLWEKHPNAEMIADGLDILPNHWALTPLREKRPYRDNWQHEIPVNRNYLKQLLLTGDEFTSKKGKNYKGFSSGYGLRTGEDSNGLLAIDFDGGSANKIYDAIADGRSTPKTISWTSGKVGRKQLLFQLPKNVRAILRDCDFHRAVVTEYGEVKADKDELLEFRYSKCQSVLPPSYHPQTGQYNWINSPEHTEVAIAPDWICELVVRLAQHEKQLADSKKVQKLSRSKQPLKLLTNKHGFVGNNDNLLSYIDQAVDRLGVLNVYSWSGHQHKERGTKLFCYCPIHGGSSGTAFQIDLTDYTWYCHNCEVGGGAVEYLSLLKTGNTAPKGKEWLEIAKELCDRAGVTIPEWKPEKIDRKLPGEISREEFINKFGLPWVRDWNSAKKTQTISKEQWENVKAVHSFRDILTELLNTQNKVECLAIVPIKSVGFIHYLPNSLPDYQTYLDWEKPLIYFGKGERKQLLTEMINKGYPNIHDSSLVGFGKSHQSGELSRDELGLIAYDDEGLDVGDRLWYISQSKENPSTITVEENFNPLIDRHDGKVENHEKLLPSGKPSVRRVKDGEKPDRPGNCPETKTFLEATKIDAFIPGGYDSEVCSRCKYLHTCEFLQERKRQLKDEKQLSVHISQISGVDVSKDVAIVEEPSISLETEKEIVLGVNKLIQSIHKLQRSNEEHFKYFAWIIDKVVRTLEDNKKYGVPKYGLTHLEFLDYLAWMIDFDFGDIDTQQIAAWKHLQQRGDAATHPLIDQINHAIWIREFNNSEDGEVDPWSIPTLQEIKQEVSKSLSNQWAEIFKGCLTPEAKQKAIRDYGVFNSLKYIIDGLLGKCDLSVNPAGELVIKRRNWATISTLKRFKTGIYLETVSRYDLERKTGIKNFAEVREVVPGDTFKNLKIKIVKGNGKCGKLQEWQNMRESGVNRLLAGVGSLIDKTKKVGLLTYSTTLDIFEPLKHLFAVTGWLFNHSRGTNIYQDCDQLIIHGNPVSNINSEMATYHIRTGKLATGDKKDSFWAYQQRLIINEIIQAIGRVRAHRRPDQQIEVVLIAGDALSDNQINQIQQAFPGAQVEVVDIIETCPQAASKGRRTTNEMLKVMWEMVQSGAKVTIEQVALALQVSKACISKKVSELPTTGGFKQLIKSLLLLYKALKAKVNFLEMDEDVQFCYKILMDCAVGLESGEVSPEIVAEVLTQQIALDGYNKTFAALRAIPRWALRSIFKALFGIALNAIVFAEQSPPPPPIPLAG